jgi:hypothetical protein
MDERLFETLFVVSFSKGLVDVPELLTMEDVVVDGKFVKATLPKELQRPWVNLTPMVSFNKNDRVKSVELADTPRAVSAVVRAFLCASYNDSKEWLTPKLSSFMIEFYTMAMTKIVNRLYNLDFEEAAFVNLLFAWYYATLLGPEGDKQADPIALRRARDIIKGKSSQWIDEKMKIVNEIRGERDMSIQLIVEVLNKVGPKRMSDLRHSLIYKASGGIAMTIAMDYPPYLLHQILSAASGTKNILLSDILNNRFSRADVIRTLDQIVMTKQIFTVAR